MQYWPHTYPDPVITACGSQSSLSMGFEVGGVDWSPVFMPRYEDWSGLHDVELRLQ